MKLGKREPQIDSKRLKLKRYLPDLPSPPQATDWIGAIAAWGQMKNDVLSDCVFAGIGHAIQTFTANTGIGVMSTIPDDEIVELYSEWAGYDPKNPESDQGYFEVDALNHWRKEGFAGHQLLGYADPEVGDITHIKQTILLFGGVYIGLSLPLTAQKEEMWSATNDEPGSWGGHAVWVPSYNPTGPICITWGQPKPMTWSFFRKYTDEAHCLLSQDFMTAQGTGASGFDLAALQADLEAIKD